MKPERKEALAQFHRSQLIAAVRRLYESSGEAVSYTHLQQFSAIL